MERVIEKTLQKLSENTEWTIRYKGYLSDIWNNRDKRIKGFRKPENLSLYSTVGSRNENCYFLRFKGQNVGKVTVSKRGQIKLKSLVENGKSHELNDCPLKKEDKSVEWHSTDASKFRQFFTKIKEENIRTKSPEHFVENRLLREFRQKNGYIKLIRNIQPVLLHDLFFQMPTPLKASGHEPTYSEQNGGGIDIMTRIKTKNGHIRLCVMEVKDENVDKESQKDAMTQAIIYATFIAKLLDVQEKWIEFFAGHHCEKGKISPIWDKKDIEVVTIMPRGNSEIFDNKDLSVKGTDFFLHCRTLYYDKSKFENKDTSVFDFSGSFLEEVKA